GGTEGNAADARLAMNAQPQFDLIVFEQEARFADRGYSARREGNAHRRNIISGGLGTGGHLVQTFSLCRRRSGHLVYEYGTCDPTATSRMLGAGQRDIVRD